jgi:hypothetical protein
LSPRVSVKADGLSLLRTKLEEAIPFEMGDIEYEGQTWQLLIALTSDPVSDVPEESPHYSWTDQRVEIEKWLFLNIELDGDEKSRWSFGFDCNDSEALVFLRQLLREQRLMVGFPGPSRATRLKGVADSLIKTLGDTLELYIPRWRSELHKG